MDLKDVLTPLVTLAGVWLAARFTLRNEISKKALEIRTARLESIAGECSDMLTGILNYAGSLSHLVGFHFRMKGEKAGAELVPSALQIPVSELGEWVKGLDEGNRALNPEKLRHCRHLLAFHRPAEARRWDEVVSPLLTTLNDFMLISMPGEPMRDMKGVTRSGLDALKFEESVSRQLPDIGTFQKELTALLSAEFVALTRPVPSLPEQFLAWSRKRFPSLSGRN
ncbi:hypothetical protein PUG81_27760 [Erwiniaceae bacterium L1_54_6]|nr:hypothetical protein [Erwiniaceae bacterium L1_54_6]